LTVRPERRKRKFRRPIYLWRVMYRTGNKWQVAGASGANDRETTLMGTLSAAGTGSLTITLTPYGLSKLNSWIKARP
jgi:hypothetical protein